MSTYTNIQVSIITACRNEIRHLGRFMDSVLEQELETGSWEAIVADGMSDDGTWEALQEYASRDSHLRVIRNPGRIVSTGLNAAIRSARGRVIIRMDAHTTYDSSYCQKCVSELERTGADNVGGPIRTHAVGLRARAIEAAYKSGFSSGSGISRNVNYEGWVDTVVYGCWRKETLERLAFFDETLVRNQDDELNFRLLRGGGKIWQSPCIISSYSPRSSISKLFRQYFQYGFWKVAVICKHRLLASWRHIVPILFIGLTTLLIASVPVCVLVGATQLGRILGLAALVLVTGYISLNLLASFTAARRHGWSILPWLPLVFATLHWAWGLGFLTGTVRLLAQPGFRFSVVRSSAVTKLSR
jgi:succinoglycan biosynthesis protein ExoA